MRALFLAALALALALALGGGVASAGPGAARELGSELDPEGQLREILAHETSILSMLRERSPQLHTRLLQLERSDRIGYLRELGRLARAIARARQDPEALERAITLRSKTWELEALARAYQTLPEDQRPARRSEISRLTSEVMDLKQAERRARLAEMRSRLEALQAEIEGREARREQIVREYVEQLLDEPVEL